MFKGKKIRTPLSGGLTRQQLRRTQNRSSTAKPKAQFIISLVGIAFCLSLVYSLYDHERDEATTLHDLHSNLVENTSTSVQQRQAVPLSPVVVPPSVTAGLNTVAAIRQEFYRRYGGEADATAMLERGLHAYGSVEATAKRILRSAANNVPFVLSFAGYSVTVGRGNHYSQSYPFVLGRVLEPLIQNTFQVGVTVRNSAIGGIPSYPYGFCFEHFLGADSDIISWDFSMNEGRGAAVLESYLRQSQHQLPHKPMVILLDMNKQRCPLLEQYATQGLIADAMCVGMAKDAVADVSMLDLPDDQKAPGFREWQEFGAPKACPGRGNWHPKRMEHELIGWMMAMYFVQAVEKAESLMKADANWKTTYQGHSEQRVEFPKPMSKLPANNEHVTDLLFGHANGDVYTMKDLSCRTNFLPATDEDKVLPSIVVSGLSPGITAENILEERSDDAYKAGWVLDVSSVERGTKIKVEKPACGGLGYVDLKTALYGVPASGTLRLWLPMEGGGHDDHDHADDMAAKHWFDELVICEANEKRGDNACHLDQDLEYTVGGVPVTDPSMVVGAAEYLKRKTCVHVGVPETAIITKLGDVQSADGAPVTAEVKRRLAGNERQLPDDHVGLVVDVKAKPNVSRKDGACCLSHIVWEQH